MSDTENRLVDIETKIAFQEDTIQELNKIVYQQQQKIDQLECLFKQLKERVKTETDTARAASDPSDDIPPHY